MPWNMVQSVKELWKTCYGNQKVYRAWYNKYVSKISIYMTWLLLHTSITPNQVTIIELILVILSQIFLFSGNLWHIFIGLMIFQLTNLLDCVDGEIARYKKNQALSVCIWKTFITSLFRTLCFFHWPLEFFCKPAGNL